MVTTAPATIARTTVPATVPTIVRATTIVQITVPTIVLIAVPTIVLIIALTTDPEITTDPTIVPIMATARGTATVPAVRCPPHLLP